MDQYVIGKFIAQKRKEQNLTQEQLAEQLGVSNKTVSKWETGKSMPDYSIVTHLCETLGITLAELMDGAPRADQSVRAYDDEQILDLIRRTQELERQCTTLSGTVLTVVGIALQALSYNVGGSTFRDFCGGLLLGISIAACLAGVYIVATTFRKQ